MHLFPTEGPIQDIHYFNGNLEEIIRSPIAVLKKSHGITFLKHGDRAYFFYM